MSWVEVGMRRMLTDWWRDPQRRIQVRWSVINFLFGCVAAAEIAYWPVGWWRFAAGPAAGWLLHWGLYEFALERLGLAGPYYERTPAGGTTFKYW